MLTTIVQTTVGAVLFGVWVYFVAIGRADLAPLIGFIASTLGGLAVHVVRRTPQ